MESGLGGNSPVGQQTRARGATGAKSQRGKGPSGIKAEFPWSASLPSLGHSFPIGCMAQWPYPPGPPSKC